MYPLKLRLWEVTDGCKWVRMGPDGYDVMVKIPTTYTHDMVPHDVLPRHGNPRRSPREMGMSWNHVVDNIEHVVGLKLPCRGYNLTCRGVFCFTDALIMMITSMCNMIGVTLHFTQEMLITVAEIVDQSSRAVMFCVH